MQIFCHWNDSHAAGYCPDVLSAQSKAEDRSYSLILSVARGYHVHLYSKCHSDLDFFLEVLMPRPLLSGLAEICPL